MGGHSEKRKDSVEWDEKKETAFLTIVYEKSKNKVDGATNFKPSEWTQIGEELHLETGLRCDNDQLRGKHNRLRADYRHFCELLAHTGVTYDSTTNTVSAGEDVWQSFFKKNARFKHFKTHGCKNYQLLGQVYSKSTATGQLQHTSSQVPPSSDEEREREDEFLHGNFYSSETNNSDGQSSKGKGKRSVDRDDDEVPGHLRVKKNSSKNELIKDAMNMWQTSLMVRMEKDKAKMEKRKESNNKATSPETDPYSIEACMDRLESMGEKVSDAAYEKVIEKFTSVEWRKIFMRMSDSRREAWVSRLS